MARQLPEERVSENTPEGMVPNDATVEGVGENIIQAEDVGSGTPGQAAATEELGKPATEETVAEQSSKPSAAGGDQGKDENQSIEEALNILDEAAKEGDAEAVELLQTRNELISELETARKEADDFDVEKAKKEAKKRRSQLEKEIAQIKKERTSLKSSKTRLQKKYEKEVGGDLNDKIVQANNELEEHKKPLEAYNEKRKDYEEELNKLKKKRIKTGRVKNQISSLEDKLKDCKMEIGVLEWKISETKKKYDYNNLIAKQTEIQNIDKKVEEKNSIIKSKEKEIEDLENNPVNDPVKQKEKLKQLVEEKETQKKELDKRIEDASREYIMRKEANTQQNEQQENGVVAENTLPTDKTDVESVEDDVYISSQNLNKETLEKIYAKDLATFKEIENSLKNINKDVAPETIRMRTALADKLYHIVRCDGIMSANDTNSETFKKANEERTALVADAKKLGFTGFVIVKQNEQSKSHADDKKMPPQLKRSESTREPIIKTFKHKMPLSMTLKRGLVKMFKNISNFFSKKAKEKGEQSDQKELNANPEDLRRVEAEDKLRLGDAEYGRTYYYDNYNLGTESRGVIDSTNSLKEEKKSEPKNAEENLFGSREEQEKNARKYAESIINDGVQAYTAQNKVADGKETLDAEQVVETVEPEKNVDGGDSVAEWRQQTDIGISTRDYAQTYLDKRREEFWQSKNPEFAEIAKRANKTNGTQQPGETRANETKDKENTEKSATDSAEQTSGLSLEEWQKQWNNDEELFEEIKNIGKNEAEENKTEGRKEAEAKVVDIFNHIIQQDEIMKANQYGSDAFNKAKQERAEYIDKLEELLHPERATGETPTDNSNKPGETPTDDGNGAEEVSNEGNDRGAEIGNSSEEVQTEGNNQSEATGGKPEDKEEQAEATISEAIKTHQEDLDRLKEKEGILNKWQDVQAVLETDYKAATRRFMDRAKRARCSYEIKEAAAQKIRAEIEVGRLQEIADASAEMVDAEKEFGVDSEQYIKAKNERERLYNLYNEYAKQVGYAKSIDNKPKGIVKNNRTRNKRLLKPANQSKAKSFWDKIKKPAGVFALIAAVAAAVTGGVYVSKHLSEDRINDPTTNNPPIEQPADDETTTNEKVEDVEESVDTGAVTEESKQSIQDKLLQGGIISSEVSISGVEAISYRKDGDVEKANIYLTTKNGWIIEYQSQVTKEDIAELCENGATVDEVVSVIQDGVPKDSKTVEYKKLDESKYAYIYSNVYSDAEDIEFSEPGKKGDYTSIYYKVNDKIRTESRVEGNIDFIAFGPDSVVKVDDKVEFKTKSGQQLNLKDPSALLNAVEKELGGVADSSGYNGKITTSFGSEGYVKENGTEEFVKKEGQDEGQKALQDVVSHYAETGEYLR